MRMHSYQGHLQIWLGAEFLAQSTWTENEWNIARWSYVLRGVFFFFLFPSKWLKIGEGEAKRGRENPVRREKSERGKGQWGKNNNEDEEKQRNKTEVLVLNKDLLVAYQINRPRGSHIQESVLGQQRESVTHVKNIFNRTEMPKTGLNGSPVVQWVGKGDVA